MKNSLKTRQAEAWSTPRITSRTRLLWVWAATLALVGCAEKKSEQGNSKSQSAAQTMKPEPADRKDVPAVPTPSPTQVKYSLQSFAKHAKVSALLDASPLRPGDPFVIAIVFDLEEGWHIYGNPAGPGVGRATTVGAEKVPGATITEARYAPGTKTIQDFGEGNTTWVWESRGKVIHYLSGRIEQNAKIGLAHWLLKAKAQACTASQCLPSNIQIPLSVPIAAPDTSQTKEHTHEFTGYPSARVPPGPS